MVRSRRCRDRTMACGTVLPGRLLDHRGDGLRLGDVDRVAGARGASVTVAPVRSAIERCAGGGIIRSSPVTRYQLGLTRQAASLIVPPSASTPQGTWESAMNAASPAGRSPANDAWNLSRSRNRTPSWGGRIGGCGPSAGEAAVSVLTDSPLSGGNAARD